MAAVGSVSKETGAAPLFDSFFFVFLEVILPMFSLSGRRESCSKGVLLQLWVCKLMIGTVENGRLGPVSF